jgi:hypothetical protein
MNIEYFQNIKEITKLHNIINVSVNATWHILRLWMEKMASRYGYTDTYNSHTELITMNIQHGGLAKANNSQNPADYNMRSPILWDVAPHLTRKGSVKA